jgi:CRP/FNR family transcriptional regulator, cyclic AMP receptor protein
MAVDKLVAPLMRVPLFATLKPLQLTELARQAERIAFRPGSTITAAGEPGDGAYLIVAGEAVRIPAGGGPAQPIETGSLVGELAMLTEHVYGVTVIAQGRVNALKITRAGLHAQMRDDPKLAEHFTSLLAERLKQVAAEMRTIDEMLAAAAGKIAPSGGSPPATVAGARPASLARAELR